MKRFYHVTDVMEILEISQSRAYKVIAMLNEELKTLYGKKCERGKVEKEYFDRCYFFNEKEQVIND